MDYLKFVPLLDRGLGPNGARDDLPIMLYRDSISFQAESRDKLFEGRLLQI